jgi:hypothetical protein
MSNTIKHKRSSTAGAAPSASDLADGELALNTADGEIFLKKQDGTVKPLVSEAEANAIVMAIALG